MLKGVCYSFCALRVLPPAGTQFTCFNSTKVQILTPAKHAGSGGTRAVLRAVGGGSKSAFWMQLFADILVRKCTCFTGAKKCKY